MNEQTDFERLVADQLSSAFAGTPPESAVEDTIARAGGTRRLPEWLALIKEPPMRTNNHLAVGSPTVRVIAVMAATLLLAVGLAATGAGVQRLLAADGPIVVAADGSGDYLTITEAVEAAQDGDEIVVMPGTYTEAVVIDKDITLSGEGPREEIIIRAPEDGPVADIGGGWSGTEPYAVRLLDTSATFSNATLEGERSLVHATGGSPTVSGLHLVAVGRPFDGGGNANGNAIMVNGGSSATVTDNTITDGGPIGVFDLSEPLIEGNTLVGGAHVWGGYGDGAVIRGNTIEGTLSRAIYVDRGGTSPTIEANTITNPGEYGILVRSGSPAVLDNGISGAGTGVSIGIGSAGATVSGNGLAGNDVAISWLGGAGLIEANTVSEGKVGIIVSGSPSVRDNTVEGVEGRGIVLAAGSSPILSGNSSCGNGQNLVIPDGATPKDDGTNEICEDAPAE